MDASEIKGLLVLLCGLAFVAGLFVFLFWIFRNSHGVIADSIIKAHQKIKEEEKQEEQE